MSRSQDAADAARDAEVTDNALQAALVVAEQISAQFTTETAGNQLAPKVTVEIATGGDDQPVFIFSLAIDLSDEFDPAEFPEDDVATLAAELRGRIVGSEVDDWDWLVRGASRAPTAA